MLLDLLRTAHAARVLSALHGLGGKARFTRLREAAGIGDQQLTRALRYLNGAGLVGGRVLPDEAGAPMEYSLTRLGAEAIEIMRDWHELVHARPGTAARAVAQELGEIVGA